MVKLVPLLRGRSYLVSFSHTNLHKASTYLVYVPFWIWFTILNEICQFEADFLLRKLGQMAFLNPAMAVHCTVYCLYWKQTGMWPHASVWVHLYMLTLSSEWQRNSSDSTCSYIWISSELFHHQMSFHTCALKEEISMHFIFCSFDYVRV